MLLEVALPVGLYQTFVYRLKKTLPADLVVGRRVLVPFKNRRYYGFVVDTAEDVPDGLDVKDVIYIDDFNTFTKKEIEIIKKISDFYLSPLGLTVYYFIPNYLKGKNLEDEIYQKIFKLNEDVPIPEKLSKTKQKLIGVISDLGEVSFSHLKMLGFSKKTVLSLLKDKILIETDFSQNNFTLRQQKHILKGEDRLAKPIYSLSFLTDADRLYKVATLVKGLLSRGCSSLIVFPSVASLGRYHQVLSQYVDSIKIYHDGMPSKKQLEVWLSAKDEPSVILGTMSSMLIPAKNLKLICLELEHSDAYRSQITPKFDAKRVAYLIAKTKSASVVYSDRLPSLESYMMIRDKKADILSTNRAHLTNVEIKKFSGFVKTIKTVEKIIQSSLSVLIITNKSYYASYIHCERCGFEWLCDRCDVPMRLVVIENKKRLKCPECGKEDEYSKHCPDCDNRLTEEGFGRDTLMAYLKNYDISLYEENRDTKVKVVSSLEGKLIFEKYDTVINVYPDFLKNIDRYDANELFFRSLITPLFIKADRYICFSNISPGSLPHRVLKGENRFSSLYEEEIKFRQKFKYPPAVKYTRLEFFGKTEMATSQLREFIEAVFKKEEIRFEYRRGVYYKTILNIKDRERLRQVYGMFGNRGKLTIEINTKNI